MQVHHTRFDETSHILDELQRQSGSSSGQVFKNSKIKIQFMKDEFPKQYSNKFSTYV